MIFLLIILLFEIQNYEFRYGIFITLSFGHVYII